MPKFSYSQNGYPKKIIWQGDTLVVFTPAQAKIMNLVKSDRDKYRELHDNITKQTKTQDVVIIKQSEIIKSLEDNSDKYAGIIMNNNLVIEDLRKIIKREQQEVRKLKLHRALLGVLAVGGIGLALFN